MVCWLELRLHRARAAHRRRPDQNSFDSHRTSFRHAGHQSANCSLFLSRRANCFSSKAFWLRKLEVAHRPSQAIRCFQHGRRLRQEIPAMTETAGFHPAVWRVILAILSFWTGAGIILWGVVRGMERVERVNSRLPVAEQFGAF